ncbi:hypothetical protein CLD20_15695 [Afifella sp. IM 167]|nr:hypothetical protein [Afifella sp. IM 167]
MAAMIEAEKLIVEAIARERAALRAGQKFAAAAYHTQLRTAAGIYLASLKNARDSLASATDPDRLAADMERRRRTFADLLRVELAALASSRILYAERMRMAAERKDASMPPRPANSPAAFRTRAA